MSGQLKIFYILNNIYPLYQKNVDVRDLHLSNYRRFGSAIYILYIIYSIFKFGTVCWCFSTRRQSYSYLLPLALLLSFFKPPFFLRPRPSLSSCSLSRLLELLISVIPKTRHVITISSMIRVPSLF